ncbi:MAG: adenosine kinase [Pseudomonadota bacterium]
MKYHVYGIGNALVDKEFEVSDEFLEQQQIEKRMMTLIDDDQHLQLLDNLKQTFGLKKRAGGGSAANTMVAISQFGGKTFYACKVGDDEQGQFYMHDLHAAGVKTRLDQVKKEGMTGKCMVMVTPDAERTMNTFLGITSDFSVNELHFEDLKASEYLYIEGYLVTSDLSRAAVCKAREIAAEHGVKTAMTFSDPSMVTYFRDGVDEILGDGVDLLFCNQEEAQTYTGMESLDEAIEALTRYADKLVITLGSKGALVVNGEGRIDIDAVSAQAIDTNGAGDMFAGAFLYAMTHGMSDRQAGELASRAAAKIVATFGARLEQSEHQALLQ